MRNSFFIILVFLFQGVFPQSILDKINKPSQADLLDPEAQYQVAMLYFKGSSSNKIDDSAGYFWANRAALRGHAESQVIMGTMFYLGKWVKRNYNEALFWFKKAALQNNPTAHFQLGVMYHNGQGTKVDYKKALDHYRIAVEQNHPAARFNMGLLYYFGYGVKQNKAEALKHFRLAADPPQPGPQGNISAQYKLAQMYYDGDHVSQDLHKAYHYFSKAARQGDGSSQYALAQIHFIHKEFKDENLGIEFLTQSAKNNIPEAQYDLAVRYFNGEGIKQNPHLATFWCFKAKNQGFELAIKFWNMHSLHLFKNQSHELFSK